MRNQAARGSKSKWCKASVCDDEIVVVMIADHALLWLRGRHIRHTSLTCITWRRCVYVGPPDHLSKIYLYQSLIIGPACALNVSVL